MVTIANYHIDECKKEVIDLTLNMFMTHRLGISMASDSVIFPNYVFVHKTTNTCRLSL